MNNLYLRTNKGWEPLRKTAPDGYYVVDNMVFTEELVEDYIAMGIIEHRPPKAHS